MRVATPESDVVEMEIVVPRAQAPWTALLWRRRRAIAIAALAGALAGEIAVNVLPPSYEASARLLIVPVADPTAAAGGNAFEAANATLPVVVAILHSRRVADATVEALRLDGAWRVTPDDARKRLIDRLVVATDRKANLMTVSFEDRVPARARAVVGTMADRAAALSKELWTQQNREHRQTLERELDGVAATLAAAEDTFRVFRERNRVVDLPSQMRASVEEAAALARLRIDKTLDLRFARSFGDHSAIEVQKGERERAAASTELAMLAHGGAAAAGPLLPLDELPRLEVEHARLKRAVDELAARHELLALKVSQLVAAEARPGGLAEIIDPPIDPRTPSGPSMGKLICTGTFSAALLAALFVLLLTRRNL
ncbi:MAG TPA: Wzz/FepE/Etk N-terminal domain-containing protein [Polyangia bacterium]|jgi:uncharacterized protein involved in exopolysaccharide biosynthesis